MLKEIHEFLKENHKPGQYISIDYKKPLVLKSGKEIFKLSTMVVRLGIDYAKNFATENLEKTFVDKVIWTMHKYTKVSSTNNDLLVCYPTKNNQQKAKSTYYDMDGEILSYEDIEQDLYAKDKHSNKDLTMFYLNVNYIVRIGSLMVA